MPPKVGRRKDTLGRRCVTGGGMGRKTTGRKAKGLKRQNEGAEETLVAASELEEVKQLQARPDEDLFTVDRDGGEPEAPSASSARQAKRKRRKELEAKIAEEAAKGPSPFELKVVDELMTGDQARKQKRRKGAGGGAMPAKKSTGSARGALPASMGDPWGDEDVDDSNSKKRGNKRAKAQTAPPDKMRPRAKVTDGAALHPGLSYNPSADDHDEALMTAAALEIRRETIRKEAEASVTRGMSAETRALIVNRDSDDEDDDDDEGGSSSEGEEGGAVSRNTKKNGKFTKAERNRQKRAKAAQVALLEKKDAKRKRHELHNLNAIAKDVKKEEEEQRLRREALAARKADVAAKPLSDKEVLAAPTIPVNTPDEIKGSMRLMTSEPTSLLKEKVHELTTVGFHPNREKARVNANRANRAAKRAKGGRFKVMERYK